MGVQPSLRHIGKYEVIDVIGTGGMGIVFRAHDPAIGRTVAINGTGGTDHGTAGIAFLFGGAVTGGTVHAEWSGLKPSALKDGRDLPARTDMRAIFKSALSDHFGIAKQTLDEHVFPDSSSVLAPKGLIRA